MISDGWDIWQIAANGKSASNLTKRRISKPQKPDIKTGLRLTRKKKGYDFSKPQYFQSVWRVNKKQELPE